MRLLRNTNSSSLLVGVILLLLLLVFAGPNNLPRFVSGIFPQFYEGVPCSWLRTADDRANHQSLLGRSAENPLSIRVAPTTITRDRGMPSSSRTRSRAVALLTPSGAMSSHAVQPTL